MNENFHDTTEGHILISELARKYTAEVTTEADDPRETSSVMLAYIVGAEETLQRVLISIGFASHLGVISPQQAEGLKGTIQTMESKCHTE